ncbi:hypothetical protein MPSEU_000261100 [Mayamaea pseudoterrestris]|nr:hypothetical protein MPSEU_000261100 [Mayamaea pseudoterrestris]
MLPLSLNRRTRFVRLLALALLPAIAFGFAPRQASRSHFKLYARYTPPLPPPPPPPPLHVNDVGLTQATIDKVQQQLADFVYKASLQVKLVSLDNELVRLDIVSRLEELQRQSSQLLASASSNLNHQLQALSPSQLSLVNNLSEQLQQLQQQLRLNVPGNGFDYSTIMSVNNNLPLSLLQSYKTLDVALASTLAIVLLASVASSLIKAPRVTQVYPLEQYDPVSARLYFRQKPLQVLRRASFIATQSLQFGLGLLSDYLFKTLEVNEQTRAYQLADLLTKLGPSFIKVGQSLSIRTDLLSPAYLKGLATLQDQVPAFDTETAKSILLREWKLSSLDEILQSPLTSTPIAAASLGQVYKATLKNSNKSVAIKVQRPHILEQIALDMHLVREAAPVLKRVLRLNTDVVAAVDVWGTGFIDELDYEQEATNAETFNRDVANTSLANVVFAPQTVKEYSTRKVLVTEWIDGERLDQSSQADVTVLCSIAMNTYLTMLLDESFSALHADPHPGNLLRTTDGRLCILDWGMVTRLDSKLQLTLIEHVAHLVSADYDEVPRDLLLLDFIAKENAHLIEDSGVVETLAGIYSQWSKGGGAAAVNVNEVVEQLQALAAKNDGNLFQLPAYFAYIAKSFSVLEGIGLTNDRNYSIVKECLPYISQRLLTDTQNLGPALNTFLFGPDKSNPNRLVDYDRVEQLVEGFGDFTVASSGALLGKESERRVEVLEGIADKVLDLILTEEPSPLQEIFLEQLAKIIASGSRTIFERVRERSGILPSGRTLLGTVVDPLGLWRTSPLFRTNELDEKTLETTQKLIDLVQRQLALSNNVAGIDLSNISREESIELSSILTRKIWERRAGVFKTGSLLTRQLLKLTADKLDAGERDTRRIPQRSQIAAEATTDILERDFSGNVAASEVSPLTQVKPVSPRLEAARLRIAELQQDEEKLEALSDVYIS